MSSRADELTYVLETMRVARQEVVQDPKRFEPNALEHIEQSIHFLEELKDKANVA
jgi:hypothetical protein